MNGRLICVPPRVMVKPISKAISEATADSRSTLSQVPRDWIAREVAPADHAMLVTWKNGLMHQPDMCIMPYILLLIYMLERAEAALSRPVAASHDYHCNAVFGKCATPLGNSMLKVGHSQEHKTWDADLPMKAV